jgi:hypothetical protein
MHTSFLFLGVVAVGGSMILGACTAGDAARVAAGSVSGGGGGPSGTGGASGGGGMCNAPPPPSPTLPNQPGCYENPGSGWIAVPCSCDLWLVNTRFDAITATIELTMKPPDVPTLTGPVGAEVAFDDPEASWYATWSKQAGNGTAFVVTSAGGTTTVKMGTSGVTLAPVPIAACSTRKGVAQVNGSFSVALTLHADLADGAVFATKEASCSNPPPVSPPAQ